MLGRRAAIGSSIAVLAVVGGGGAFAATHGSSNSSTKPAVHKVVRPHAVAKPRAMMDARVRSGHHCSHSGNASAEL
ncbi:MAG: hypothetical protein QOH95_995 [Gaiellaceae bacterium]|jgi:hypothetical protein|nr:hypothetical protein [Gaiellaceae bacterium]